MVWIGLQAAECERRTLAVLKLFRSVRNADRPEIRALRLLRSWLSPSQLAQFDASGYFDVVGSESGKTYRIKCGISANILELTEDDSPKVTWCVVPDGLPAPGDVMLAQKIALETCEGIALSKANKLRASR